MSSLLAAGLLILASLPALAAGSEPLQLNDHTPHIEAWPAVTILADPSRELTLDEVSAQAGRFTRPTGASGSLGLRNEAVWLHLPLAIAPDSDGRWILDIDYAPLNRIDVYVVQRGALREHFKLGNTLPRAERPLDSRAHAAALVLTPGSQVELFVRVETLGAMILPITLNKASSFLARSVDEQMLQGLLTGLGVFLLLYSLGRWLSLGEPMYPRYALLVGGSVMFSVAQFGLGAQYLWVDNFWIERHMPGTAALVSAAATFLFVGAVLAEPGKRRWFDVVMKLGAAVLLTTAAAYLLDWINVHTVSLIVGTVGLLPALLGMPGAIARARRGDQVGWSFLAAWTGYFVSTWIMVSLVKGHLPANWWTLHSFQFGATLDMLLFMRVLSLQLRASHTAASDAAHERDVLRLLADTDALTGLPNRRYLAALLRDALPLAKPDRNLALYMLDLDGFKQVNDLHGHDVGDELLVAVAQRLKSNLRDGDVVARVGGDEFLVAAPGLSGATQADALGQKLLQAIEAPFNVAGRECRVGITIGYVLAPNDGSETRALIKAADAAMYVGKQSGKNCVRRGTLGVTSP